MTFQKKLWTIALDHGGFILPINAAAPYLFKTKVSASGACYKDRNEHAVRVLVTVTDEITPKPKVKGKPKRKWA